MPKIVLLSVLVVGLAGLFIPVPCLADRKKRDTSRPIVHIAYFIPTDRKAEPQYRERLDRVMSDVQRFYRLGMKQNGYGDLTFQLGHDPKGLLQIHEVKAKGPMRDYGRNASDKVRREVKEALAKQGIDIDRETIIIFQLLLEWRGDKAIEIGPYVGGGGAHGGTAWVYDDARLDARLLSSRKPGGFYMGPCSLGQLNTHYIGGLAHELGHAFGLPHDCERDNERPRRGLSLMGGGNHTYRQELRGEGKGTFLSSASALPLSVHPLFTGKRTSAQEMTCGLTEFKVTYKAKELILTARLQGGPRPIGVVAHNDAEEIRGDYDAVGWTASVDKNRRFRLVVGELKPGDYELRLGVYGESGDRRSFAFRYHVGKDGEPDLRPFSEGVWLQEAQTAFRGGKKKRLAELVGALKRQDPADSVVRRKVEHLQRLLSRQEPRSLVKLPANISVIKVADLKMESATVGWGQPVRNQVLPEGTASCLIEVGGVFFESGLYAHAPARHLLRLDGKWTRFTTKYGLQDGHNGSVVFVIKGDGKELFRSKTVRDHTAREQAVPVARVKLLELIVEDAGDGTNGDWGVWLDPQLRR
jgi:hypothetical protein